MFNETGSLSSHLHPTYCSLLPDENLTLQPSNFNFFEGFPFESDISDSFGRCQKQFATCTVSNLEDQELLCNRQVLLHSPEDDHLSIQNVDQLQLFDCTSENLEPSILVSSFEQPSVFQPITSKQSSHNNQLSFCSPRCSFDVVSTLQNFEAPFRYGVEEFDRSPQLVQRTDCLDSSMSICLCFSKVVTDKKTTLKDFSEILFHISPQNIEPCNLPTLASGCQADLEQALSLSDDLYLPTSSSGGRSRISKLQHDILNNWFYSHLDHP